MEPCSVVYNETNTGLCNDDIYLCSFRKVLGNYA